MVVIIPVLLLAMLAADGPATEFSRYPGEPVLVGVAAPPDVSSGKARKFRTVLREAAKEGPNFNGHYRVAHWGCGTNCIEWAIIDLKTGAVWFAPQPALSCWALDEPDDVVVHDWFETRIESKLLYLYICDPPFHGPRTENTREVYVWEESGMKKLRSDKLP